MKKNGFTLIELIGVIAIIALVMIVAVPSIMSTLTKSTNEESETFKHDLQLAAESYVESNWNVFKVEFNLNSKLVEGDSKRHYCLPLKTLVDNNYIKDLTDPSTKETITVDDKYILLTNESSSSEFYKFSFTYVDTKDEDDSLAIICKG